MSLAEVRTDQFINDMVLCGRLSQFEADTLNALRANEREKVTR